ncbi:ribonucleotide reductase subunit alpha [Rhodoferax sp.]|jgi:hypothetical protein|uniref:ribonucleotide reductase subunit alpha n=1 Tax=Rhodoferax sp. TaxID=50421 RepID=UPI002615D9A4|nr:ribonucleotide reductase subunit alpha [Rhodoferax sp.]MDD2809181.1 ribonucleotide reductase subunit alpha [Rhodoferax sp.]MDD4944109.1 ribonucleotide reductase subunit alpha [Rhodoferax sp.]
MNIQNFEDLLQAARTQPVKQRLLFVFVDAELPDDASAAQRADFEAGQGGALVPLMCVDKDPHDLTSFGSLVQEAAQFGHAWRFVFAGALSGSAKGAPNPEIVETSLQAMVESIKRGEMSRYLAFDRQGSPVVLG